MSKIVLIVRTKTQPGKRDEVRKLFEKHLAPRALANDAQEVEVWCDDDKDADTFYLFEIYNNAEALQANSQAVWFWDYLKEAQPLLTGESEVVMATPRWAKGVAL